MIRYAAAITGVAILLAAGTVAAVAFELHRAATPETVPPLRITTATATTSTMDPVIPLLEASIAAADTAAKACEVDQ